MNLLFIHKKSPGQFEHLIRALSRERHHALTVICQNFAPQQGSLPGVRVETYEPAAHGVAAWHPLATNGEAVANGLAVAAKLQDLKSSGFVPDLVFAHLGWGESIYFKDVFPACPLVGYCEFYHHPRGVDADFDPEYPLAPDDVFRIRTANAAKLLGLVGMDMGVSPTRWQRGLFPPEFQRKITVIHEGVDTARIKPDPEARFRLPNGLEVGRNEPIVTFATRNLEPYRGFHVFMRAVAEIKKRRKDCRFIIAGADEVSYGAAVSGESYRDHMLRELKLYSDGVHFVGYLPFQEYIKLLQVSRVHVYLTVPFVLSWSLLEAMAAACVIVGSDTAPVREVLRHGRNGLLADFFSPRQIADQIESVLDHPQHRQDLGRVARADVVDSFDLGRSLGRYRELIENLHCNQRYMRGAA